MNVDLFDFDLPEDRIALRPASPRDAARLLVVRPDAPEALEDRGVRDLVSLLRPGDARVLNDTRVIPSRLRGRRYRGEDSARVEIMLHKRESEDRWLAFARPAKKLAPGETVVVNDAADMPETIEAGATVKLGANISMGTDQQIETVDGTLDGQGHTVTINGKAVANNVAGSIQNLGVTGYHPIFAR